MGVRRRDRGLRDSLQTVLDRRGPEIQAILKQYKIPLFPIPQSRSPKPRSRRPRPRHCRIPERQSSASRSPRHHHTTSRSQERIGCKHACAHLGNRPPDVASVHARDLVSAPSPPICRLRSFGIEYHKAPRDTVTQEVYDGWKQYNLNCARCHGEDVQGTTIAPHLVLSLKPEGPVNTKPLFVQTVCAGRPAKGMPSWCALGMEMPTIEKIYAYVKGRSEGKIGQGRPALKPGS